MTSRAQRREVTQRAILDASLRLLAEGGQESLTVRGLARELNLVPSALYRYVTNRADLLNILFMHVFNEYADAVQAAHDAVPREDVRGRWRAVAHAQRDWSTDHHHEWTLINGTPPRDYAAPSESQQSASRVHVLLAKLGADVEAAGWRPRVMAGDYGVDLEGLRQFAITAEADVQAETLVAGVAAWHMLVGALRTERFKSFAYDIIDPDDYYALIVAASERLLFGDGPAQAS
jgi:AcrR family transcriptional regulator